MAKLWRLLVIENYMFRPIAAIIRFGQLSMLRSQHRHAVYAYYTGLFKIIVGGLTTCHTHTIHLRWEYMCFFI